MGVQTMDISVQDVQERHLIGTNVPYVENHYYGNHVANLCVS